MVEDYAGRGGLPAIGADIFHAAASTPSGAGYWVTTASGAVWPFGDAPQLGSTQHERLNQLIVPMASTPSGRGY